MAPQCTSAVLDPLLTTQIQLDLHVSNDFICNRLCNLLGGSWNELATLEKFVLVLNNGAKVLPKRGRSGIYRRKKLLSGPRTQQGYEVFEL